MSPFIKPRRHHLTSALLLGGLFAMGCGSDDATEPTDSAGSAGAGGSSAGATAQGGGKQGGAAGKSGGSGHAGGGLGGSVGAGPGGAGGQAGQASGGEAGSGQAGSGEAGSGEAGGGQAGGGQAGGGQAGGEAGGDGGSGGGEAGSGGSGQVGGAGGAAGPTCKQAGGDRCGGKASECAGLTQHESSDCVVCCEVPKNPVYDANFADPFVVRVGDTYHAFSTNGQGKLIPRIWSKNLIDWKLAAKNSLDPGPWAEPDKAHWAPTVYQAKNGKWVMYYAGQVKGSGQHCLGRAVADAVTDTFVDKASKPFICKPSHWSLDPSVFHDQSTDKDFLLWRQDISEMPAGTVHIRQLDQAGQLVGDEHELIRRAAKGTTSWEYDADGGVLENPAMIRVGGVYHLFYSGNRWETAKYANGHAVCEAPFGPCTKTSKAKPWQGSKGDMLGPGGADFVRAADGTIFMYMHGWDAPKVGPDEGKRKLWFYRFLTDGKAASIAPM